MTLNWEAISRPSRRPDRGREIAGRVRFDPRRGVVSSGLVSPWVLWLGSVVLFIEIWSR